VIKNSTWTGDDLEFILQLYEYRLKQYYVDMLKIYAKKWNCESLQEFEMEAVSKKGFWLAKKKYALDLLWKEGGQSIYNGKEIAGQYFKNCKRKYTGIEVKKKSSPIFARNVLNDIISYLFDHSHNLNMNDLVKRLKKYKEEFKLENVNDISMLSTISNYNKYVIDDRTSVKIKSKCPIHIRGAALHNYLLNNNSKQKQKYEMIRSGNKVKYYYIKSEVEKEGEVFSFIPGNLPMEIAPEFDYDIMFSKVILNPVNRFIIAMGKSKIPDSLTTIKSLW